jgi:hypothetical protein
MKRLLLSLLSFAVVALCGNAVNVERVYTHNTPRILQDPVRDVLHIGRKVGEVVHLNDVRTAGVRVHNIVNDAKIWESKSGRRYLLSGDSMMEAVAPALTGLLEEQNLSASTYISRGSVAGGELWDWEGDIGREVRRTEADVVMLMLDAEAGSVDEYVTQIADVTKAALQAGASQVVWLVRPPTLDVEYEKLHSMRRLALDRASSTVDGLVVLDATRSVLPTNGGASKYVTLPGGERVKVRQEDGVHLTARGGLLFAEAVLAELNL